jgi:hypothetical protein
VRRNIGFAGPVSIQYATSDGTATAGGDYTTTNGMLNWAAGELDERTITVPLVNDAQSEGTETFRITLSNLTGGATLDGLETLDVQITNDDAVAPPPGNGGVGGGGAIGTDLLWLFGLLLFAAGGHQQSCRRANDRADQMRLRYDGRA